MKIKEIMNSAFAVDKDVSIKEAAKIMAKKDIGSLVAVKEGKILGIITERDVIKNIESLDKKISAIMNKTVVTVNFEEEIDNAAILMKKNKIKRLPVMDDSDKLVGIITATDLIANSDEINEDFLFD